MTKYPRLLILIIAAFTALRLLVAPQFGLGVDEAHYLLYALHLDWSYLDHPPLVGWVHFLFYGLPGTSEFWARFPAIILFAVSSLLVYRFTINISGNARTALWAVIAVNSSFMLNALGIMLLPDSLLLVLVLLIIDRVVRLSKDDRLRHYLLLGLFMGLAGLAKYTAILLVPALAIYFIVNRQAALMTSPRMILAALIALGIISPVLYWNFSEGLAGFDYQINRVFAHRNMEAGRFFTSLGAQFGAFSPFLFVTAWYGFFHSWRSQNEYLRLALPAGGIMALFFLISSFYEVALPHWMGVFYLIFIPVGVHFLSLAAGRLPRYFLYTAVYFSLAVTLFLYVFLAGKFIGFPDYQSPFRDIFGYDVIASKANPILRANPREQKGLAVGEWTMGSRVMYYGRPYGQEVFIIDDRRDQFDFWQKADPIGYDLLVIESHFSDPAFLGRLQCEKLEKARQFDLTIRGGKVDTITMTWCYNYQGRQGIKQ